MIAAPVFAIAFAAVVGAVLAMLCTRLWRVAAEDDGRLRLGELLERRGAALYRDAGMLAATYAARRCVLCPHKRECDRWLAGAPAEAAPKFCPNAELVERLAR